MSRLVQAARSYLGVRWKHLGRSRDGLDCAGLILVAYADCGVLMDAPSRYGRDPFKEGLMSAVLANAGPPVWSGGKGNCRPHCMSVGDVVLMSPASRPRHMGLIGDSAMYGFSLIHADGTPGAGKVNEDGMGDYFLRQIVAVFRRPVE